MNATKEQLEQSAVLTVPEIVVPTAQQAITLVNRWLQKETAMLIHVTDATFNPITYCWYLPVKLSYPDRGTIGEIGDVYLNAVSGQFTGLPDPDKLLRRAESLAEAHGLIESEEE
ncbi:MAG: hypothetical protein ACRD82_03585 [Blastocatellia bacterium]